LVVHVDDDGLPLPLAPQLLPAGTVGGGMGDILRIMDILIQEKEGPEGLGKKNFKIQTQGIKSTGKIT
jgi:hypothetical protein